MFLRIFGFLISAVVSLVIYFEVSNTKFSSDEPNKDKLLVDLVSYVLDKLHYDPKIINDDFSINVYEDFIDAVDSQKRFLLKSDIELFSQYRLLIDDQIKSSDITFFNVVYETLERRMDEVESFYKEDGLIKTTNESIMIIKTFLSKSKLEKLLMKHHPYDIPFIAKILIDDVN